MTTLEYYATAHLSATCIFAITVPYRYRYIQLPAKRDYSTVYPGSHPCFQGCECGYGHLSASIAVRLHGLIARTTLLGNIGSKFNIPLPKPRISSF